MDPVAVTGDQTGCDLPGEWSEMDHAIEADLGGPTSLTNGRFLCLRHHHLRHEGWMVTYDPVSRHCSVTSPLGITWTGDGHLLLSDDPDPPPWE